MGGPLPDRLLGLLEGGTSGRRLLASHPAIGAALSTGDYQGFIAHLTVRRRALPRAVLMRVAEELATAATAAAAAADGDGRNARLAPGVVAGAEAPVVIPPAYVDLIRGAAAAAGGWLVCTSIDSFIGRLLTRTPCLKTPTLTTDDRLPSPAHLRTLLLALRGGSGSGSGDSDHRAALATAIVEELRAWGQVNLY